MGEAGEQEEDGRATNWAYLDQYMMKEFAYTLDQLWEMTLPETSVLLQKFLPRITEPTWFINEWREATNGLDKMLAMQRLMG